MAAPKIPFWQPSRRLSIFILVAVLGACSSSDDSSDNSSNDTNNNVTDIGDAAVVGVNLSMFGTDALASSEIVDCELSDDTVTQCYSLRTTGAEKTTDLIGPFCPETTSTSAENAGIWLDGESLYEADGDFILNLPNLYGQSYPSDSWASFADAQGNVNITETLADCEAAANPNVGPEYAGFCVQCDLAELTADLQLEFLIPVSPQPADASTALTASAGISLNGFQIAAQAPVEAILSAITVAPFDDCGGHVNPNDGYHYHAATARDGCNSAGMDDSGHPQLMGYAMDGYGIYGPLAEGSAESDLLDECNGTQDDTYGYHYHAGSPELNQHISCFSGKTVATNDGPGRPGGRPPE